MMAKFIGKIKKPEPGASSRDLTEGAIGRGLLAFAVPGSLTVKFIIMPLNPL